MEQATGDPGEVVVLLVGELLADDPAVDRGRIDAGIEHGLGAFEPDARGRAGDGRDLAAQILGHG